MADPSSPDAAADAGSAAGLNEAIAELTDVLLAVAQGNFDARASRSFRGDALDVLAFLINATAEETGELVKELERQREELKKTRDQLLQSEKLAALGQLAAGVAHELNQPLTAIRLAAEWMLARPDAPVAACSEDVDLIRNAAARMGGIVDGIRTFARGGRLGRRRVPATQPLEAALSLVQADLRASGISVERRVAWPEPEVNVDPDRLQQVFVNLLLNARDALDGATCLGAKLIVLELGDRDGAITYAVEDNGPGVALEHVHVQRLFDPFFTTKPVGLGTGLGLSISHGIVAEHGSTLRYESVPTGGSRFVFTLAREGADDQ